jgi:hypothetical protein
MKSLLVLFCLIPFLSFSQGGNGINLVNSGQSSYSIVVPNDVTASENYAAAQLSDYLFKVSGAKLNIINESAAQKGHSIHVGLDGFVKSNYQQNAIAALGKDGILIKTVNGDLIISGGRPRGSLNAVYQFLEDYIGCRWWTPTTSTMPHKPTITLTDINVNYTPPFFYRDHFIYNTTTSVDFAATLHEDGDDQALTAQQGGNERILGFVHTFGKIMPLDKYFSSHPEWYTDPANHDQPCTASSKQPAPQKTQLCLTNNEMYAEFLKNVLQWIQNNPSYSIISISQNDYPGYCHSAECNKIVQEEGSPSGLLLRFVNRIAADVAKKYPDKKIETLAYESSINAPRITKPANNVIIRIAPVYANMGFALNSPQNQQTQTVMENWKSISNDNFYWGYNTNFANLLLPHPSFYHVGDDLKFLAANNFKAIFIQDNKYTDGLGYFIDMQAWVVGHLMWNPSLDQKQLVNEFMLGYYGQGGKYLTQYMDLIDETFRRQNKNLPIFNNDFSFLTVDVLNQGTDFFNQALATEKNNKICSDRIQKEKTALDFTWVYLYKQSKSDANSKRARFMGPSNYDQSVDSLFEKLKTYNVQHVARNVSNDQFRAMLKKRNQ